MAEHFSGNTRTWFDNLRHLAHTAMENLPTRELSTHGEHFVGKTIVAKTTELQPMPTHFDEEFTGEPEQGTYPEYYRDYVENADE